MGSMFNAASTQVPFEKLFNMGDLSEKTQRHLSEVYSMLSLSMMCVAFGSYVYTYHFLPVAFSILSMIVFFGMMLCIMMFYPYEEAAPEEEKKKRYSFRRNMFLSMSFFYGFSIGPLIEATLDVDPSALTTALVSTAVVFLSFTISALYSPRRSFLFLGGIASSLLSVVLLMGLANIFIGSSLITDARLYIGLVMFCLYILYDTQVIVEKAECGYYDVVGHALELYVDVIGLFIRILVIILNNKKKNDDD